MDAKIETSTKDVRISTSSVVWRRFDKWMQLRGYKSLAEGIRAAMLEVIRLDPECQSETKGG